ncbi:hypothetical protein [Nocardia africana]|uniref:Uncharacterized protein n=1 Tax=Nocardia africana TaxID=134964 RepID=A0A378X230_9NOCA|nr:hypothetical protein [Nocardia africana]MCC3311526.1 hypothetical protein [Nocardia africana]SUA47212.1 Uncharacterised protein [Nocardia africana]
MTLPEKWTVLRPGPTTTDPSTGNAIPGEPEEVPWTGLLQQRIITGPEQEDLGGGVTTERLTLLLDPGLPGGLSRRDVVRFDGPATVSDLVDVGGTVTVQGTPRVRRPATGSRRPAYIAAIVRHASDMKE